MKRFFFSVLIFLGGIIVLVGLLLGYVFLKYRGWEKEFDSQIQSEYVIDSQVIKSKEFNKKITQFSLSLEDTQFLELNVQEIGSIVLSVLESYAGEDLEIEEMYISPSDSLWYIYVKVRYQDISVWISTDINKDQIQSAQIYVTDIKIGPFSISKFNTAWVDLINSGIGDSIVTLNENGLVGRYIENIELREDSVVLKGSRY